MVQGAGPGIGPEEYVDIDYEYEKSNEELEEAEDIEEVPSEPHPSEMLQDHPAAPEDPADWIRSLEEEVATLRQQLLEVKAQAVQGEHERDETIREMSEMDDLVARHFGI